MYKEPQITQSLTDKEIHTDNLFCDYQFLRDNHFFCVNLCNLWLK